MTREYQPRKNNPYLLPHNVYMQTLYVIRDYPRLKAVIEDIGLSASATDGMPKHSKVGSSVENVAIRLERVFDEVRAVERALDCVPEFYRSGIWRNILYRERFPQGADFRTFQRWKQRFIYETARNLKKI